MGNRIFPIFKIKYFDPVPVVKLVYQKFLFWIVLLVLTADVLLYLKNSRKINERGSLKLKIELRDIFGGIIVTGVLTVMLAALTFSMIVTTNAYMKPSKTVIIKETVIWYRPSRTKTGGIRHYIKFKNPVDKKVTELQVYRKYQIGEVFTKEMKVGRWGLLYSFD